MPNRTSTSSYDISVTINLTPKNQYGDIINDGTIHYTAKTSAQNLKDLGDLLTRMDAAIKGEE